MYHIAICDDDRIFIQYMKKIILSCGIKNESVKFYEYYSGEDFITRNKDLEIDLLFLDMQMKEMGGNETAKIFREKYPLAMLVFCSGICQPTVESFETMPFRYLLKEYSNTRMISEIKVIIDELKRKKDLPYIIAKRYYSTIKLVPEEILYIAIAKHGSNIFLYPKATKYNVESNISSEKKISELYMLLREYGFEYAHNSYIVNLKYIKRKTLTELEMLDGTILSVSRSKEKELRSAFAKILSAKY